MVPTALWSKLTPPCERREDRGAHPGIGVLRIDPAFALFTRIGQLDGEGVGRESFLVPQDTSLAGFEAHWQAYLGDEQAWTNVGSIRILDL